MKKLISVFTALTMLFSMALPMSVVAEVNTNDCFQNELSEKIRLGGEFLTANGVETSLSAALDTYTLFRAGVGDRDAFLSELDESLKNNDGKIIVGESESLVAYACVINILNLLDLNPSSYNGYDIVKAFIACENKAVENPYYYRAIIEACVNIGNTDMANQLCDELITEYYTLGKGMNYWGYSCDNTAVFLTSIAPCKEKYDAYVKDALNVLEHYTTYEGCFYSDEYTDIAPDSTASTLMAYAALGDNDTTAVLYNRLYTRFEDKANPGVINYYGSPNAYSTKNAVLALTYINSSLVHKLKETSVTKATCISGTTVEYECEYCTEYKHKQNDNKTVDHSYNSGVVTKKATCTATGVKTYTCTVCKATKTEPIAKIAHTYKPYTTKATTSKNGSVVTKCSVCGAVKSKSTIYYPKTISLSTTSYTYDGKVKKPSVKVVGSNGKAISSSNYTVSYASGRKNVGKYAVKITFKGNYSGTKTLYFTIKPKSTSISSVSAKSKGFTVKWKKQSTQTTGYQIQYSTSSKFTNAKTVTVSKNSTTSKTISKLSAKKKYYVRVRTYKTVNGTKYYSAWSKYKTVTTKK